MKNFKELQKSKSNLLNAKREFFGNKEDIEILIRNNFNESMGNAHSLAQKLYCNCKINYVKFDFRKEKILISLKVDDSVKSNNIIEYSTFDNSMFLIMNIKIEDIDDNFLFTDAINRNFKEMTKYRILEESKSIEFANQDILDYKESIENEIKNIKESEESIQLLKGILSQLDDIE